MGDWTGVGGVEGVGKAKSPKGTGSDTRLDLTYTYIL